MCQGIIDPLSALVSKSQMPSIRVHQCVHLSGTSTVLVLCSHFSRGAMIWGVRGSSENSKTAANVLIAFPFAFWRDFLAA